MQGVMMIAVLFSLLAGGRQKIWLEAIQGRVEAISKMLSSMKGGKLLGISNCGLVDLQDLREIEIKASEKLRQLLIAAAALGI